MSQKGWAFGSEPIMSDEDWWICVFVLRELIACLFGYRLVRDFSDHRERIFSERLSGGVLVPLDPDFSPFMLVFVLE